MGREARRVPRWIDEAVHDGLELARTGRRDEEALEQFFVDIKGSESITLLFRDEEGDEFVEALEGVPYFGNKSARIIYEWHLTEKGSR